MKLSDVFANYLKNFEDLTAANNLVLHLKDANLLLEAYLLSRYITGSKDSWINLVNFDSILADRRFFLSHRLPKDAQAGDIWFDVIEIMPMLLVAREPEEVTEYSPELLHRMTPFHSWISINRTKNWQFEAFLKLAETKPRKNQVKPPREALELSRISISDELSDQSKILKDEAGLYALWFNKSLPSIDGWRNLKNLDSLAFNLFWSNNSKEWLGKFSNSDEGLRFAINKFELDSDLEEDEATHFGEFFFSEEIFMRTSVDMQIGLSKSRQNSWLTEIVSLDLLNTFERDAKIIELLRKMHRTLLVGNEKTWADRVLKILNGLESPDEKIQEDSIKNGLSFFGGAGSLNDIVLHRNGIPLVEENDVLESLKTNTYKELAYLSGKLTV
jgi:hypothetical protein